MWWITLMAFLLASAADRDAQAIARAIEAHYHSATTLRATFLERYSQGRESVRMESGTVLFSRPGRMRWEYESPERKLFLVDGKTAWFYVPADRIVIRAPVKESADWRTPLALLTGKTKLSRLCSRMELLDPSSEAVRSFRSADGGHVVLRCLPRGEAVEPGRNPSADVPLVKTEEAFSEVFLGVDPRTGELERIVVRQPGGVEMEYRFANWRRNLDLAEALFHFQAPVGVTVMDAPTAESNSP